MVTMPRKILSAPLCLLFENILMRSKPPVYECPQILTDLLAAMPISNAEGTRSVLRKAVETFTEGLVINFFPHSQQLYGAVRLAGRVTCIRGRGGQDLAYRFKRFGK